MWQHFGTHRRCAVTASEYRRCNDSNRRCAATASEFRRCNQISPTLLSLLTQQVGMASKSNNAAENAYAPLVMVSLGAN
jgi:hypothetical protein